MGRSFEVRVQRGELEAVGTGDAVAVIDVIRAFTVAHTAMAGGIGELSLWPDVDELREQRAIRNDLWIAGEVGGLRPPGFDFGNSPAELSRVCLEGRALAMRTTNGVRGVHAALKFEPALVLAAAFVNARATARRLRRFVDERPRTCVHLYATHPTGDDDLACAEYLRELLLADDPTRVDPTPYRLRIERCEAAKKFFDVDRPEFDPADIEHCVAEQDLGYALVVRPGRPAPFLEKEWVSR